jgi:single-strand DNA-binding protein
LCPHLCIVNPKRVGKTTLINSTALKQQHGTKLKIMNALKNKVQLIGNLGNAPEVKTTETGKKLVRFSMATNETYTGRSGKKETETTWHNIIAWGKVADIAEKFLIKGKEIAIEGKLINRNYTDKEGVKKYVTEVQLSELLMIGGEKPAA